jgi:hypothetical protein
MRAEIMVIARSLLFGAAMLLATGSTALACQGKTNPVLDENFKNADPGWGQADNIASFTANGLVLTPPPGGSAWRWNAKYTMDHADLCIQVTSPAKLPDPPDEDAVGSVGVWFWGMDSQNFYTATITLDGGTSVDRLIAGTWQSIIAPSQSQAVKTAPGGINEIEIVTNGNAAVLYVNGTQLSTFTGQPPSGGGWPGLYAESGPSGTSWLVTRVRLY